MTENVHLFIKTETASNLQKQQQNRFMRKLLFSVSLIFSLPVLAQVQVGVFTGIANYQGDLVDQPYQSPRLAAGLTVGYSFSERLAVRAGLTLAKVDGADSLSEKAYLRERNLSFQSRITELSLRGEYSIFNLSNTRWSPYLFGGLALYHFNPYTFEGNNDVKVFLKPLSTEGQGWDGDPANKPYSLTQFAIPFGGGVRFALSDNVNLGFEIGIRKLFTDYLDDVSTNYADASELLAQRGPLAVAVAYRGTGAYPPKGSQRGGMEQKDWYYFSGFHLSIGLGDGGIGRRTGTACPKF
jgi:opacity protein-like surface antigen